MQNYLDFVKIQLRLHKMFGFIVKCPSIIIGHRHFRAERIIELFQTAMPRNNHTLFFEKYHPYSSKNKIENADKTNA